MRPSNKSRSRNKSGNSGSGHNNNRRNMGGNVINRVFESAGPDGKVRGTPQQIIDKYQALARDAQLSGDRVVAENFLQHSEHYSRLLGEAQRQQMEQRSNQQEREDFQRDDNLRSDGQQRNEWQQRTDDGQSAQQNNQGGNQRQADGVNRESSGLTTIDPVDSDDLASPVETPEGKRQPRENAEERSDQTARGTPEDGGERPGSQQEATAAPAPAKRPRTRRKAKADPAAAPVEAQAD